MVFHAAALCLPKSPASIQPRISLTAAVRYGEARAGGVGGVDVGVASGSLFRGHRAGFPFWPCGQHDHFLPRGRFLLNSHVYEDSVPQGWRDVRSISMQIEPLFPVVSGKKNHRAEKHPELSCIQNMIERICKYGFYSREDSVRRGSGFFSLWGDSSSRSKTLTYIWVGLPCLCLIRPIKPTPLQVFSSASSFMAMSPRSSDCCISPPQCSRCSRVRYRRTTSFCPLK